MERPDKGLVQWEFSHGAGGRQCCSHTTVTNLSNCDRNTKAYSGYYLALFRAVSFCTAPVVAMGISVLSRLQKQSLLTKINEGKIIFFQDKLDQLIKNKIKTFQINICQYKALLIYTMIGVLPQLLTLKIWVTEMKWFHTNNS